MVVPNSPYKRCHLLWWPASAFEISSSGTFTPYCWIQQINALFEGIIPVESLVKSSVFEVLPLVSIESVTWHCLTCKVGASLSNWRFVFDISFSLSRSGWVPMLIFDDINDIPESVEDGGGTSLLHSVNFWICADFRSSRSPHNLKSCSLTLSSKSRLIRRLS